MEHLHLEYFSTGEDQHVFTRAGDPGGPWLYKIPAAFGTILPGDHPRRGHAIRTRLGRRLLRLPIVDRLDAAYMRESKRRRYRAMIRKLALIEGRGIADVVLPFHYVPEMGATLHVDGATVEYRGHVLIQRRADFFWETFVNLAALDWEQLVAVQYRMWSHGVGLASHRDALGPRCWAMLDGRVALADTGSLTASREEARAALDPARLARRFAKHLDHADGGEPIRAYIEFVGARITQAAFDERWRPAPGGRAAPRDAAASAAS